MRNFFKPSENPLSLTQPPKPSPTQPAPGGLRTTYRVEGIWRKDGSLDKPTKLIIELEGGQRAERVGDLLHLTRLEAAVLGKNILLVPVFNTEE